MDLPRRKGIILAGGSGSRLHPLTKAVSKQLMPIHDKPMIYYPLSTLMLTGIHEILIISTPEHLPQFHALLGTGEQWGLQLSYKAQETPDGLPSAFIIGEDFLAGAAAMLILGDNIFYGDRLPEILRNRMQQDTGATIFAYHVSDPERFGVVEFGDNVAIVSLEEKPRNPKSNWAITSLYLYDRDVAALSKTLKPSARGEYEITDLNRLYLERGGLTAARLGRGMAWLDMGTPESLLEASQFVHALERRQGLKVACPEEIAMTVGLIDREQFNSLAKAFPPSTYGDYLRAVANSWA